MLKLKQEIKDIQAAPDRSKLYRLIEKSLRIRGIVLTGAVNYSKMGELLTKGVYDYLSEQVSADGSELCKAAHARYQQIQPNFGDELPTKLHEITGKQDD